MTQSRAPYRIIKMRGFLSVLDNGEQIMLQFSGNQGNNLTNVQAELDGIYGAGTWAAVQGAILDMSGHPDYLWSARLERDLFQDITQKKAAV